MIKNPGLNPPLRAGHKIWYDSTQENLNTNRILRETVRENVARGRIEGYLPITRDLIIDDSNKKIHKYNREINLVVYELDKIYELLNPKNLLRLKGKLEKALFNIRKDVDLNSESIKVRQKRPHRERALKDKGDQLLLEEKQQLRNIKSTLEAGHKQLQSHLSDINDMRKFGFSVISERKSAVALAPNAYPREFRLNRTKTSMTRSKSLSRSSDLSIFSKPSPTGAYTPDCHKFKIQGERLHEKSLGILREIDDLISEQTVLAQTIVIRVNAAIRRRLAETENLISQVKLSTGHQNQAIRTAKRYRDKTVKCKQMTIGPESINDLLTSEKLYRPMVRNYQNHYGNKTNEIDLLVKAGKGLDSQRHKAEKDLKELEIGKINLQRDKLDKQIASSTDAAILRARRRKVACM